MTTELDKARRDLQASFNLGIARGVEFVTNIEALIRAILAEQDGSRKGPPVVYEHDGVRKVAPASEQDEDVNDYAARAIAALDAYRWYVDTHDDDLAKGGLTRDDLLSSARRMDPYDGNTPCLVVFQKNRREADRNVSEVVRKLVNECAAREKAERERDEALKWNKIAMEQVAARDRQIEKAEAELAALRDIFVWIEDGPGLECIPNDDIQEAIRKAIPNIKALAQERRAARQSRNEEGGGSDNSRADSRPDIAQPARDGDEPPAPAATCADCGLGYDDPGFCDLVVPNDVWAKIAPRDGDGLLCPTCMCRAAHRAGIQDAPAIFRSGPFSGIKGSADDA